MEEDFLRARDDVSDALNFLLAARELRECHGVQIEEVGGTALAGRSACGCSGIDRATYRDKTQGQGFCRTRLPQKVEHSRGWGVSHDVGFKDKPRRCISQAVKRQLVKLPVAANTPIAVTAATAASQQASARYQAGLGTIVEVADAQRLLTQAEIDDALARLSVWRALLLIASASGNIQPFLADATR